MSAETETLRLQLDEAIQQRDEARGQRNSLEIEKRRPSSAAREIEELNQVLDVLTTEKNAANSAAARAERELALRVDHGKRVRELDLELAAKTRELAAVTNDLSILREETENLRDELIDANERNAD